MNGECDKKSSGNYAVPKNFHFSKKLQRELFASASLAQIKHFFTIITSIIINNSTKIGGKKNLDSSKRESSGGSPICILARKRCVGTLSENDFNIIHSRPQPASVSRSEK